MQNIILIICLLCILCDYSFAGVNDFRTIVSDPPENLIYPQQILAGEDGNIYILDTISNSSHIKVYSSRGELLTSLLPSGTGKSALKFNLGLTLISGKNIFSIDKDGAIFILDNEDGYPVIKSFSKDGKLQNRVFADTNSSDSSYGALAVEGTNLYLEYDDQIFITNISFKDEFTRFIGKKGESIDNWDVAGKVFVVLSEGEVTTFNQSAIPIFAVNIGEILGNPSSLDVFDLSISSDGFLAVTGSCQINSGKEKPFLVVFDKFSGVKSLIFPDKYIKSLDWGKSNELYALVSYEDKARIIRFDLSLNQKYFFEIVTHNPALVHPSKVAVSSDGALWVDDQNDTFLKHDPYALGKNVVLSLKRFYENSVHEIVLDKLGDKRFGSFFLDEINGSVILSGLITNSSGIPISSPIYEVEYDKSEIKVDLYRDSEYLILCNNLKLNEQIFIDSQEGYLYFGRYLRGKFDIARQLSGWKYIEEGIPAIFPIDEKKAVVQIQTLFEGSYNPICTLGLKDLKPSGVWKPSEYADLKVLYSCNDGTIVIYWYPQGLIRADSELKILSWIGLGDDSAYNFVSGYYRDGKNYVLDARYNLVYSFDNSAWEKIYRNSTDDVRSMVDKIRNVIGNYYAYYRKYPSRLTELIDSGLADEEKIKELFDLFLGESPVAYFSGKYDYTLILWGKDADNTMFKASSKGIEQL